MSMASVAAQQNNALAAATTAAAAANNSTTATNSSASTATAAQTGQTALTALSGNFSDFLGMLMTQLQNQDPTSPMDTNQFTSELVEFSGVEQQINTNNSLTQLIQLTQAGEVMQGASLDGKQVTIQSNQIALQNGSGTVNFTTTGAEPVAIAITSSAGQQIRGVALNATAGQNTWTWNGTDNNGNSVPDGAYNIAVIGANPDGSTSAVPFTVTGTVTNVQSTNSNGVQLQLGGLSTGFGSIVQLGS
ncbi:MAG: flagellar hook assembly protein FlgD [Acetobacteraceae bacterium]